MSMDGVGTEKGMPVVLFLGTNWLESMMDIGSMLSGGYMRPNSQVEVLFCGMQSGKAPVTSPMMNHSLA
jgi:hypothetical protein